MNTNVSTTLKPSADGTVESHFTTTPVMQATRHGVKEHTGLHKEKMMDWVAENIKDEELLGRLDLELLTQDIVAHGDGLSALVGEHNKRPLALTERFNRLADDRKRLVDFKAWAEANLDDLLAERARLMGEAWDWLQAVRSTLAERQSILKKAEDAIGALLTALNERREQTVVRLNKSMAKTRREYIEANPYRGVGHFIDLLNSDDDVVAIDQRYARLKSDLEWVLSAQRRVDNGASDIRRRQEEVFEHLLN